MSNVKKTYIGDGVYVEDDGLTITLTTEDGLRTTNTIILDRDVILNLENHLESRKEIDA